MRQKSVGSSESNSKSRSRSTEKPPNRGRAVVLSKKSVAVPAKPKPVAKTTKSQRSTSKEQKKQVSRGRKPTAVSKQ